jgi:FkbM family methyltransferase
MKNVLISIIIPTYNSASHLNKLFESCIKSDYKSFEIIINDNKSTTDKTANLIKEYKKKGLSITYLKENISMSQARLIGSRIAKGEILLNLDSDMILSSGLLSECVSLTANDYDALVLTEQSIGKSFWAKCKALEKKCYEGVTIYESLRCIKKRIYNLLGGHDPELLFSEDKDLDIRVRKAGYKVGRTIQKIYHDEGSSSLKKYIHKKMSYSATAQNYKYKHPEEYKMQFNIWFRFRTYLKNIKYLFTDPIHYSGMLFMKLLEYFFSVIYIFYSAKSVNTFIDDHRPIPKYKWIIIAMQSIKNFPQIYLEYLGLIKKSIICYQMRPYDLTFFTRPQSGDIAEVMVILSGNEYKLQEIPGKPNMIIVDLGCHIGSFSIYAAKYYEKFRPKIYSFEPDHDNYNLLQQNIKINNIKSIITNNTAISDFIGSAVLDSATNLPDGYEVKKQSINNNRSCRVTTLINVMNKYNIRHVDFMKIDIEGSEYALINHKASFEFITKNVANILIEPHDRNGKTFSDVYPKLEKFFRMAYVKDNVIRMRNKSVV